MSGGGGKVKISEGERMNADLAEEQYSDYKSRFAPLEESFAEDMLSIGDSRTLATGTANADATAAYDDAISENQQAATSSGFNPNSGKNIMMFSDMYAGRGEGVGRAVVDADQSTEDRALAGKIKLISQGHGKSSLATTGFGNYARLDSANARSDALAKSIENDAKYQLFGMAAGAAASGGGYMAENQWLTAPGPRKLS